jgi:hypothetical protein
MDHTPKFWALVVLIWVCLILGLVNIAEKINLLMGLANS